MNANQKQLQINLRLTPHNFDSIRAILKSHRAYMAAEFAQLQEEFKRGGEKVGANVRVDARMSELHRETLELDMVERIFQGIA